MRKLIVLLTVLITGCAGVAEMRADEPFATFASAKSPEDVAACTSEAWTLQDRWPVTPDVRIIPIADGEQVMIYNAHSMSPDAFADITADGTGSRVVYYAKHRQAWKQSFADLLQSCL